MSTRSIRSRHSLATDHATVKIRVAFDASGPGFHDSVAELVDTIGVLPGTVPPALAGSMLDISLVSVEEDASEGPGALRGTAEFAVPTSVLPDDGAIPLMLAIATYGSVYRFVREYQVIDIDFPSESMEQKDLVGPRSGSSIVPSPTGLTRLGMIIKPRFATDEQHVRSLVRQVAEAGVDYVIDDELTVRAPGLSFERRVAAVIDELNGVRQRTSRNVPFFANVTGGYAGAMRRARVAEELGAAGVMVNTVAMGYDVVSDLACDNTRRVGVIANSIGRGVMTSGPAYRVAPELLCKLARLAGADAVYTGPLVGSLATMAQHAQRFRSALTEPYHRSCSRKPSLAVMSGGLGLPEILQNEGLYRGELMFSLGRDFIRPLLQDLRASELLECITSVWHAARSGGRLAGQDEVKRLAAKGNSYRMCLEAIRAEEAVR